MRRRYLVPLLMVLLAIPLVASADLDGFLHSLNVEARADLPGFSARLSAQFGVPLAEVQVVIDSVAVPADAFMCFQLGRMTRTPVRTVLRTYDAEKGRGWGVIAKSLGIKPGSAEFHALKRGDFVLEGGPEGKPSKGKNKQKDKDKGKGKDKGRNK